jgi:WS/DGAT/MGAT family acyltransferase
VEDRLTALDATFLELEEADESAHMHIGAVMVFEPLPDGGAPTLDRIRAHLDERLGSVARFRQRLSEPRTGGLRWPRWIEDERFDIAGHVRREFLPPPGGHRELMDWAGEFFSRRLDRARPLWEMVLVDGLADGRWALASKTHHCLVDGVGSIDVGYLMLDTERTPRRAPAHAPKRERVAPDDARSSAFGLVPGIVRGAAGRAVGLVRGVLAMGEVIVRDELVAAPTTSLNDPIGGKRRFETCAADLADVKRVAHALGGTVNDVVLAAATGGLRALLLGRGEEPPEHGLRAMVPMNVRRAQERSALGNRISSLFVNLPVAVDDPLERYRATVAEAEALKSGSQALGSTTLIDLAAHAPPAIHTYVARSLFATRLFNVTITNVPGPQIPLYVLGSRLEAIWPLVPLAAAHAVGLAVVSYDGRMFFALNADHDTVPEAEEFAQGVADSLAELRELAEAAPVRR